MKVKGGIYGVAVGDALGATVEFMSQQEIKAQYGKHTEMLGGGWLSLAEGEFTDDTEMTLDVAEGILANRDIPIAEIGQRFIKWYHSNPRDIGNIIRRTCTNYTIYKDWSMAAKKTRDELAGKTAGNGCLMRTLPISFAYYGDLEKMDQRSAQIAAMTHLDDEAMAACVFYNRYAAKLITSKDKHQSYAETLVDTESQSIIQEASKLYQKLIDVPAISLSEIKASGYVVDTLIAALVMFLKFDSFEEIVIEAVNLGDDADTVGAVVGGLAGTYYGFEAIPERWLDKLKGRKRLNYIVKNL